MTDSPRPLFDSPEPCACYAQGKDKAFFEIICRLDGPPHAEGYGCQPCQVKRAMPAEGDDTDRQKLTRALRAGGGLGAGGP